MRLLLAPILAVTFTGCATYGHSGAWEYKVDTIGAGSLALGPTNKQLESGVQKDINSMTEHGWHFVSISPNGNKPEVLLVFKRHK